MSLTSKIILGAGVAVFAVLIALAWFFARPAGTNTGATSLPTFGLGAPVSTPVQSGTSANGAGGSNLSLAETGAQTKIFKVADGPVTAATIIETGLPTTTLARFVMADNGHVYDLPLGVPGAALRIISNTTIPGIARALWAPGGRAALMQYEDRGAVKTLSMTFPAATSTPLPSKIQFLPDGIASVALSPDGASAAYLLATASGSTGYISAANGANSKVLFSSPFSQLLISWPAQGTLLAQTPAAAGVPGGLFSINAKTGAVSSLLFAPGLTAIADSGFLHIVYQTLPPGSNLRFSFLHNTKTGGESPLSFDPLPEQCVWSGDNNALMYCAVPLQYVPQNYLDLWHQGLSNTPENIISFNVSTGASAIVAVPGSKDGGAAAEISSIALSQSGNYLLYITKGDRSLWAVRLTQ